MQIDSRIWCLLPQEARDDYLQWYGKVDVTFGNHVQEIALERKPGDILELALKQKTVRMEQTT